MSGERAFEPTRLGSGRKAYAKHIGLEVNPGLEAKTLFEHLQRKYPGRFQDGQLRTLQRRVKTWRALEGPPREVFFPQVHKPGALSQSDDPKETPNGNPG